MAKKKIEKGSGHRDTDEMSKSEVRSYHKEINEYFEEHGWRSTLSHFLLSPAQASEITAKTRSRMKKEEDKAKAERAKARAAKKASKGTKTASRKKKAPPRAAEKKDAAPTKAKKSTSKKRSSAKKKSTKKTGAKGASRRGRHVLTAVPTQGIETTLDYLLDYRAKNGNGQPVSLDTVIADLTTKVRAA